MIDVRLPCPMTPPAATSFVTRTGPRIWRTVLLVSCLPVVTGALLVVASAVSDSHRVPAELAAWKLQSGVMFCSEGTIARGDGSLVDRLVEGGQFRCSAWRMRGQRPTTAGLVEWPSSPRR